MKWFLIVLLALWALVAIQTYRKHAKDIDEINRRHPDENPLLFELAALLIIIFWPLMIPGTIKKIHERRKERQNKEK